MESKQTPSLTTQRLPDVLSAFALIACALLSACTSLPPNPAPSVSAANPVLSCRLYYHQFNIVVDNNHVRDAQTTPVDHFPHLQINRFLAALTPRLNQPDKWMLWLKLAAQLGRQTNAIQLQNLPVTARRQLLETAPKSLQGLDNNAVLDKCSQTLLEEDFTSTERHQQILDNIRVADNYRTWKRIVGLYPLVALPIAWGIHNWHTETSIVLNTPTGQLPVKGQLLRYKTDNQASYASFEEVRTAIETAEQNPLRIPIPDSATRQRLFATFAPLWEVDTVQNSDKIGAPHWQNQTDIPTVVTDKPTIYTLLSHTILNDKILLQLNYFVWFPARSCTSALDLLCGNMDGLIWRVTLGPNGSPLMYDTVHDCGCYHLFFPSADLTIKPDHQCFQESDFVPRQAPEVMPGRHLILRIATRTHYVESLSVSGTGQPPQLDLAWQHYNQLRSLPYLPGQNKSLFQENALVAGTQRKERWFLWPLGVRSAGAMRQWGNHATAFIGRREFDDPYLFANTFVLDTPISNIVDQKH